MSAKHTQGPWEIRDEHFAKDLDPTTYCCYIGPKGRVSFANLQAYTKDTEWGMSNEETKANALLMVMAPELLEMLSEIVEWGGFRDLRKLDEASSLVAKAKGETP